MNTYCPMRPSKRSTSGRTCSGVKARNSATTSNSSGHGRDATPGVADVGAQLPHAVRQRARDEPRLSTVTSSPRSSERRTHAELMTPVPPM